MELWWLFVLALFYVPLTQGTDEDDDDIDHSFTYSCALPDLFTWYNQSTTEYLLAQCSPAAVCGQPKTCIRSGPQPACLQEFEYIAGVEKIDDSMHFTCCKLTPMSSQDGQEYCTETPVIGETYEVRKYSKEDSRRFMAGRRHGQQNPNHRRSRHVKRQTPIARFPMTLDPDLFGVHIDTPHAPAQFVKSITKMGRGYMVKLCTIQCRSSTSTVTQTQRPSTVKTRRENEHSGHPKVGLFQGQGCFSADMTVMTPYGEKRMDQLHVGDQVTVLTAESKKKFQPIEWFYHRDPDNSIDYINLQTKSGHSLSITANHLIPFVQCKSDVITVEEMDKLVLSSSFASRAKVGWCLGIKSDHSDHFMADRIVSITSDQKRGVFTPITNHGSIVVNGVQTSCYSSLENQTVQHAIHSLLIKISRIVHSILKIFSGGFGKENSMEEKNIPVFLEFLLEFAKKILPGHVYQ